MIMIKLFAGQDGSRPNAHHIVLLVFMFDRYIAKKVPVLISQVILRERGRGRETIKTKNTQPTPGSMFVHVDGETIRCLVTMS